MCGVKIIVVPKEKMVQFFQNMIYNKMLFII